MIVSYLISGLMFSIAFTLRVYNPGSLTTIGARGALFLFFLWNVLLWPATLIYMVFNMIDFTQ
jgi:hypothetical protein